MRKIFLYIIFLSFMVFNFSCSKSSKEKEKNQLLDAISSAEINNNTEWIVILPGLGCSGCIQEAEEFLRKNSNNKKIFFVLTKIESLKILQQKTGVKITTQSNILIDRADKFIVPTDNSIYPCIIKFENGKYMIHEFQSPDNPNAISNLKTRMNL